MSLQDEDAKKPEELQLIVDVQVSSGLTARTEILNTGAGTDLLIQAPREVETRENSQSFDCPPSYKDAVT